MSFITCLSILLLDQASKHYIISTIPLGMAVDITPFFKIIHVRNHGVSFSMLAQHDLQWALIAMASLIVVYIATLWLKTDQKEEKTIYAAIIGGALGNIIDRITHGSVVDFLYFHIGPYGYPAFNLADSAIVCGVVWLIWRQWQHGKQSA